MDANEQAKAMNTEKLEAVINGETPSAIVGSVTVARIDVRDAKYYIESGRLCMYGTELEIDGGFAYLRQGEIYTAVLYLGRE